MSKRADEMNDEIFYLVITAIRQCGINPIDAACLTLDVIRALNEAGYKIEKELADAGMGG